MAGRILLQGLRILYILSDAFFLFDRKYWSLLLLYTGKSSYFPSFKFKKGCNQHDIDWREYTSRKEYHLMRWKFIGKKAIAGDLSAVWKSIFVMLNEFMMQVILICNCMTSGLDHVRVEIIFLSKIASSVLLPHGFHINSFPWDLSLAIRWNLNRLCSAFAAYCSHEHVVNG